LEDEEEDDSEPPVTTREAKCIDLLQKFFMQEGNEKNPSKGTAPLNVICD